MNYVIFGGSFDPIHNGHIRILKAASEKLNATPIIVLSKAPRWKSPAEDVSHRLNMVKIAVEHHLSNAIVSTYEIDKDDEINYTIDTIRHFKDVYPEDKLYFLIGADQVNQFDKWKDVEELSALASIVFSNRPNYELSEENITKYKMTSSRRLHI